MPPAPAPIQRASYSSASPALADGVACAPGGRDSLGPSNRPRRTAPPMQDLTTGSLTRHLLKTTGFMLVTMLTHTLYFLVDLYWVGRLGREAVAAVTISGNLMFAVMAVTIQTIGVGCSAFNC
mgnify:CR=1 FL=1